MPNLAHQFRALVQKNLLQILRRKKNLMFFVLGPLVSLALVGILNVAISAPGSTAFRPEYTRPRLFTAGDRYAANDADFIPILYAPDTPEAETVMRYVARRTGLAFDTDIQRRPSPLAMALEMGKHKGGRADYCVVFDFQPDSYFFQLWANTSAFSSYGNRGLDDLYNQQLSSGRQFALQQLVSEGILHLNNLPEPELSYKILSFPMVSDGSDGNGQASPPSAVSTSFGGVFYLVGLLVIFMAMVSTLMEEKTSMIKTKMQVMGLKEGVYIGSWLVTEMLKATVSTLILLAIGRFTTLSLFSRTDFFVLFLFYFFFSFALLGLAFFIASLVQKPLAANLIATLLFAVALLLEVIIDTISFALYVNSSPSVYSSLYWPIAARAPGFVKFLLYSFPPFNFCAALNCIQYITADRWDNSQVTKGSTFHFGDLSRQLRPDDYSLELGLFLGNLVWNAAAYLLLAWYFGQINASQSGTAKSWLFFLQPAYWRGSRPQARFHAGDTLAHKQQQSSRDGSIILHKVSKVFKDKSALKELSLNIAPGQVFCLLGHNGAGKTTTINLLTGVHTPTHGAAFMFGNDIGSSMDILRDNIGMCEQEDILWPDLSGAEHLAFFLRFRGVPEPLIKTRVEQSLDDVKLLEAKDQFAGTYSGGMKRRLCVAISCAFHPRVLFLDEPTTGMDPVSKRYVWNKIQAFKQDRIVVLTTHSMEEADVLGDEIAILAEGRLRALGNALFLKNHFGGGYRLHFICSPGASPKVIDCVHRFSPKSEIVDHTGDDVTLRVPRPDRLHLPAIFRMLQQMLDDIRDWGVSNTTLEEVFLRLAVQTKEVNAGGDADQPLEEQVQHLQESVRSAEQQALRAQDMMAALRRLEEAAAGAEQRLTEQPLSDATIQALRSEMAQTRSAIATQLRQTEVAIEDLMQSLRFALFPQQQQQLQQPAVPALDAPPASSAGSALPHPHHQQQPTGGPAPKAAHVVDLADAPRRELTPLIGAPTPVGVLEQVAGLCRFKSLPRLRRQKKTNRCIVVFMVIILFLLFILGRTLPTPPTNGCWYSNSEIGNCTAEEFASQLVGQRGSPISLPRYYNVFPTPSTVAWAPQAKMSTAGAVLNPAAWTGVTWQTPNATAEQFTTEVYNRQLRIKSTPTTIYPTANAAVDALQQSFPYFALDPTVDLATGRVATDLYVYLRTRYNRGNLWSYTRAYYFNPFNYFTAGCAQYWCWSSFQDSDLQSIGNAVAASLLQNATGGAATMGMYQPAWMPYVNYPRDMDPMVPTVCSLLPIGTMVLLPIFVAEIAEDHSTKSIELMRMMGLKIQAYWVAVYVFQMAFHLVLTVVFAFLMYFFGVIREVLKMAVLILFWGHAEVGLAVLFSAVIPRPRAALVFAFVFVDIFGPAFANLVFLVRTNSATGELPVGAMALAPIAYINGIFSIMTTGGGDALGGCLLALFLDGVGYFGLGVVVHWLIHGNARATVKQWLHRGAETSRAVNINTALLPGDATVSHPDDTDVEEMRQAVAAEHLDSTKKPLVVRDLVKVFPRRAGDGRAAGAFVAVDRVSLQVLPNECFGLLGPNGAGKTTTISMITGLLQPSAGRIAVGGHLMDEAPGLVRRVLGVCPQENILWPDLTCRDHLALYARLKGVAAADLVGVVQQVAELTRLDGDEFHQQSSSLSGGMKRRLCIGIALVGHPRVVLLDEPTTGLDPETRRVVWKIINDAKRERCVLLTTHSMEEADALCSRIGIMTHGRFRCVGTQFHLKNKFGSGYKLVVTTRAGALQLGWEDALRRLCPSLTTISVMGNSRSYNIASSEVDVSSLFALMESPEVREQISDWGINQCSLDDVFVRIAGPADA